LSESTSITKRHYLTYLALLLVFGAGIWLMLLAGSSSYSGRFGSQVSPSQTVASPSASPETNALANKLLRENLRSPFSILLLQLIVIVLVARLFGKVVLKLGQPPVMGEIVAGILLGPSLLGVLSPATMTFLFPASSMAVLNLLSQIGVALFMFVVGLELDVELLRKKAHASIMVSHASIVVPMFLGVALALFFFQSLAPDNTSFTAFALFMGIAMSITAFPVLARILDDRGLSRTPLGGIALTCAAVGDVTAWCLLPLVIAIARADALFAALVTIGLAILFMGAMLLVVRPLFARFIRRPVKSGAYSRGQIALILAFALASALVAELIGIHALFGAFLAGVVLPPTTEVRSVLKEKLETFSVVVLLPLFFVFSGLRMQIGLLNDWQSWAMCALIIVVAITGKLGASMLMARWTGMSWRDAFALGALMNTRGLVELVVLNIGYDLGILSARAFAMLVLMALVTTFMTGPLLSLVRTGAVARP
jgi:Kef-type K+ transport system membrane component KefB